MITWALFKTTSKKVWVWLKEHWQIPFLAAWSIVIFIFTRRNTEALLEVIDAKQESYKKQVEILRRTHRNELLERDNLILEYESLLDALQQEFEARKQELTEVHEEEIKEVVIKSKGSPEEIKRFIEEEFGIVFKD